MFNLFDAHSDTFVRAKDVNADIYDNNLHISIKKLQKYDSVVQFFAICYADDRAVEDTYKWYMENVNFYKENINKYSKYIESIDKFSDIEKNKINNKISGVLAIEGAEVLQGNIDNLYEAYDLGVRSINITWNNSNELGYSNRDNPELGLTEKGKSFISAMNELGIIIDVSHLSDAGFWDIYKLSKVPFIASHSNSRRECNHMRNLTDDQLGALKEIGGVAGLNLAAMFLKEDNNPQMDDLIRHLDRMLKFAGENGVGLGCDFDGIEDPKFELKDVGKMDILYERCIKEYGKELTNKIFYENFLNVVKKIIK